MGGVVKWARFGGVVLFALAGCRGGRSELKKVDIYTQYHGVTFVEKFKIWATGPDEVVARDAFYEPENYIYDGSTIRLSALRGESEAFQLVINADYGNVNDVEVKTSALAGPAGSAIPEKAVSVYFEYFVTIKTPSDYRGRAGAVPDALPPLGGPFDLAKAEAQPLFVVVDIPRETGPGTYAGDVVVLAKGAEPQKLKLEVNVIDEVLEPEALPPAFLEPDYRALASWHRGKAEEPCQPDDVAPYFELLKERGIRPLDFGYSQRRLTASGKKAAREWAEAAGAAGPTIFYLSASSAEAPSVAALAEEYERLYSAWEDAAPAAPVIWPAFPGGASSPFLRGLSSAEWWSELAEAASSWPGNPALAAATSPFRGAPGASLQGKVEYWAPEFRDVAIAPERYTNLGSGQRYYLRADGSGGDSLDGRRAGARLLSWYGYLWGAEGIIALANSEKAIRPPNPWLDDPMAGTPEAFANGRGAWLYPGAPAGIKGAVSSVRLELWRQGLEDWALFRMVEKKRGREYVAERLKALLPFAIKDMGDISGRELGNNEIFELRRALLEELAGGPAAGRRAEAEGRVVDAPGTTLRYARAGDGTFATYTAGDGSYRLRYREGRGPMEVSLSGFRAAKTNGGVVKLYRGLKGTVPVFDFEQGIDPAYWLTGDKNDALGAAEERDLVMEGKIALAAEFPCGRRSRVINLYPRQKDISKHHRLEFTAYNPNDFLVDIWLLIMDDDAIDVDRQYRRRISLRPRGWTRVSYRTKDLVGNSESRLDFKRNGEHFVKAGYRLDLKHVMGLGFEADGLSAAGGEDNPRSYKVIIDDVKLIIFE